MSLNRPGCALGIMLAVVDYVKKKKNDGKNNNFYFMNVKINSVEILPEKGRSVWVVEKAKRSSP